MALSRPISARARSPSVAGTLDARTVPKHDKFVDVWTHKTWRGTENTLNPAFPNPCEGWCVGHARTLPGLRQPKTFTSVRFQSELSQASGEASVKPLRHILGPNVGPQGDHRVLQTLELFRSLGKGSQSCLFGNV